MADRFDPVANFHKYLANEQVRSKEGQNEFIHMENDQQLLERYFLPYMKASNIVNSYYNKLRHAESFAKVGQAFFGLGPGLTYNLGERKRQTFTQASKKFDNHMAQLQQVSSRRTRYMSPREQARFVRLSSANAVFDLITDARPADSEDIQYEIGLSVRRTLLGGMNKSAEVLDEHLDPHWVGNDLVNLLYTNRADKKYLCRLLEVYVNYPEISATEN